jgi:hypothetical protein
MEIKIDTNDILGDETTIRDEVISQVTAAISAHIIKESKETIRQTLDLSLASIVAERVQEIIDTHLDTEFVEADQYGRKQEPATIRSKIAEVIQKECTLKDPGSSYSSNQTKFTKAVVGTVEAEMKKFRAEFTSAVNSMLIKSCLADATKKLQAACGIKG